MGPCVQGPVLLMGRDQTFYQRVTPEDAADIVGQHVQSGEIVDRLVVSDAEGTSRFRPP